MAGALVDTGTKAVQISWSINPFRGDKFEEAWLPHAEAALRYGAKGWLLFRQDDSRLSFTQYAFFENKIEWERYWYSEEISNARAEIHGWFQVPIEYAFLNVKGAGSFAEVPQAPTA
ncbi:MAG: hypothetical protein H0V29_12460 [Thermoleophilaceae bacterium]|nr:hypothetical protein [Thermoleophilaceae bacterium]